MIDKTLLYFLHTLCSDEDSVAANPVVAADEDLSSPSETEVTAAASRNGPVRSVKLKKQPVEVSLSESDEEPPSVLVPSKAPLPQASCPKPKSSPKPLKSAIDIELTESEEEESAPHIMGDEDIDGKSTDFLKNGKKKGRADIFEPPVTETKKKQAGLMLQFDTSSSSQRVITPSKGVDSPGKDLSKNSPTQTRRDKKKKSKRSKRSKDEESSTVQGKDKETGNGKVVVTAADPFGAIASLDAWLNSSSNDVVCRSCVVRTVPSNLPCKQTVIYTSLVYTALTCRVCRLLEQYTPALSQYIM